jgi:histidinol-phosphate/aromatic aminotransferase/cobyric acid decarboxylase-like protein
LTNPTSDRGIISKIYKELKKLIIKNPNNPMGKKMGYRTKLSIHN